MIETVFPKFAKLLPQAEEILPPATVAEISELETILGIQLPNTYKQFLSFHQGMLLFGGAVQFTSSHPFFHTFQPWEKLSEQQKSRIKQNGGHWPPPSDGMLCFADYSLEADGDQVLFDLSNGLIDGEYPVMYYDHECNPPRVTKIADSFKSFLENKCISDFAT